MSDSHTPHILNFGVFKKNKRSVMQDRILQLDFEAGTLNNIKKETVQKFFPLEHIEGVHVSDVDDTCFFVEFSVPAGKTYEYYAQNGESCRMLVLLFEKIVQCNINKKNGVVLLVDPFEGFTAIEPQPQEIWTCDARFQDSGWLKSVLCVYGHGSLHIFKGSPPLITNTPIHVITLVDVPIARLESCVISLQAVHGSLQIRSKNEAQCSSLLDLLLMWKKDSLFSAIFPSLYPAVPTSGREMTDPLFVVRAEEEHSFIALHDALGVEMRDLIRGL
jgi:hypothetical protein